MLGLSNARREILFLHRIRNHDEVSGASGGVLFGKMENAISQGPLKRAE